MADGKGYEGELKNGEINNKDPILRADGPKYDVENFWVLGLANWGKYEGELKYNVI